LLLRFDRLGRFDRKSLHDVHHSGAYDRGNRKTAGGKGNELSGHQRVAFEAGKSARSKMDRTTALIFTSAPAF
jgi:hypothetical protein